MFLAVLMQQCAATLTELECSYLDSDAARVLPRCWSMCPTAAWLGLSQLHTLRGISFSVAPAATIAAALPLLPHFISNTTKELTVISRSLRFMTSCSRACGRSTSRVRGRKRVV
jgi:hypothetical protein